MKGTVRGECRWNYRLLISRSRVRSPPPHPRCSSVVERVFHPGRSLLAKRPTCRRVQCARRSVGEQPPFKRRVGGSIPTGHSRKYAGGMPAGLHLWLKAFGPAVRIRCPAQTCPPEQKRKEHPRRMPKELHCTPPGSPSGFNSPPCRRPDGKRVDTPRGAGPDVSSGCHERDRFVAGGDVE